VLMAPVRSALKDRHNIFVAGRQTPATKRPKDHRRSRTMRRTERAQRLDGEGEKGTEDSKTSEVLRKCCEGKGSRESTRRPSTKGVRRKEGRKEGRKVAPLRGGAGVALPVRQGCGRHGRSGEGGVLCSSDIKEPVSQIPSSSALPGRPPGSYAAVFRPAPRARARVHSDGAFQAGVPEFRSR